MNVVATAAAIVVEKLDLAGRIIQYMLSKGYEVARNSGEVNIVYIEGANADGTANADRPDEWNDRRIVIHFHKGEPVIVHNAEASSEPGLKPTFSNMAKARGGIARIPFGQFKAWIVGYHNVRKYGRVHPALIQRGPLQVHRDANMDGKRTGDLLGWGHGINQHGTRNGYSGTRVEGWSEGCLVGRSWINHMQFMALCKSDPRYIADKKFVFTTTVIAGDDFARFKA